MIHTSALHWNIEETKQWLSNEGFSEVIVNILCDENHINGKCLLALNDTDFTLEPINKFTLGQRKHLYVACKSLQKENVSALYDLGLIEQSSASMSYGHGKYTYSDMESGFSTPVKQNEDVSPRKYPPDKRKALLSFGYVTLVSWISAFVMVIVHERVPDMEKYPPLPDIFLDNIPHIPWAFEMCEFTGTTFMFMWIVLLVFHKHRFILMRRFFALSGTVFLLRCVTMLITSLSVPGAHLQCQPRNYSTQGGSLFDDLTTKISQAYVIWRGAGMSIQGVRTCGDYMFSGHTVALTMLNFFITEYTPRHIYYLHTLSWIMNMFGIFFILAAHEHYSIDVFVAFYITSRLFLYYHTLSNNQALMQRDSNRTKVWFPLFSYFESSVEGIVPNEYETPTEIILNLSLFVKNNLMNFKYLLLNHTHVHLRTNTRTNSHTIANHVIETLNSTPVENKKDN